MSPSLDFLDAAGSRLKRWTLAAVFVVATYASACALALVNWTEEEMVEETRGAFLACLDLGNACFIARESLLPLLAIAFFARGGKRDELLNIVDGQVTRLCQQRARALELKACRQQQILALPLLLPLRLGLQHRGPRAQLLPVGIDPPT